MNLLVIPLAQAGAAENMARDWLMLEGWSGPDWPRLRTYGWTESSWTFGYSQPWATARAATGTGALIRRATGGGLVDHREDWTYALVLPAAHPWATARAAQSYRVVHEALEAALRASGVPVKLAGAPGAPAAGLGVCFTRAESNDLVRADDGRKIAGAAQKRNRRGMLFQGSVSRAAAGEVRDWAKVEARLAEELGLRLAIPVAKWTEQAWDEAALAQETARFASAEWNEQR